MAKQNNHYDMAFEKLLRLLQRPYVSVNETRRPLFQNGSLKSMDFVVYSQSTSNLLIDVKGRRTLSGSRCWENWTTVEDVSSLMKWEQVFGENFKGLLVFAYELASLKDGDQHEVTWDFRGRRYAFYGVWASEYAQFMRTRSNSWKTVSLKSQDFQKIRQPLLSLL
ncbi:HYExAFE family protein [Planctomicrobium sp. SH668]|uniref:HYExAFE family protein n=1 Tax=Planctomicrobium sp. SH668 TaxID=3448126 RepID=UPI003F5B1195